MKPHGVSGAVLVASDPTVHDVFVPGLRCLLRGARGDSAPEMVVVESATRYGAGLRLRLVGIDTRDAAQAETLGYKSAARPSSVLSSPPEGSEAN